MTATAHATGQTPALKRLAGIWSLWAISVGAVISGHFSGLNPGLAAGGWGGMLVAAAITALMFTALMVCVAEISALPFTGGSYCFARAAIGPFGGYLSGLAAAVEYVLTPAVICYFIGADLGAIFGPAIPEWMWWAGTYTLFLGLNMVGLALTFRITLIVTSFLVVILNPAIPRVEVYHLATAGEPLPDGFRMILSGVGADILGLIALCGLVASFHAILYAQGRQIFALSRAGYLPVLLSRTGGAQTPHLAMRTGAGTGFCIMLILRGLLGGPQAGVLIGSVLLNMAVFWAMLAYISRASAFVLLRQNHPDLPRPFRSPFGNTGAWITIALSVLTLIWQVQDPNFQKGAVWVLACLAASTGCYAAVARHRMTLSPEEAALLPRTNFQPPILT